MGLKSGGEIIVDTLIANKVNVVFGIPGIYNLSILWNEKYTKSV